MIWRDERESTRRSFMELNSSKTRISCLGTDGSGSYDDLTVVRTVGTSPRVDLQSSIIHILRKVVSWLG